MSMTTDPATTVHFAVTIDDVGMGMFTKCEGLGMEIEVEEYAEGGNLDYVHHLLGRVKYTNVKLTRPVTDETALVAEWITRMTTEVTRSTGMIEALQPMGGGAVIVRWNLDGIVPVRWTGPQFTADSPAIATESLEIAHTGFTVEAG